MTVQPYHQQTITWTQLDAQAESLGQGLPWWSTPCAGLIYYMYDKLRSTQEVNYRTVSPADIWCVDLADALQAMDQVVE